MKMIRNDELARVHRMKGLLVGASAGVYTDVWGGRGKYLMLEACYGRDQVISYGRNADLVSSPPTHSLHYICPHRNHCRYTPCPSSCPCHHHPLSPVFPIDLSLTRHPIRPHRPHIKPPPPITALPRHSPHLSTHCLHTAETSWTSLTASRRLPRPLLPARTPTSAVVSVPRPLQTLPLPLETSHLARRSRAHLRRRSTARTQVLASPRTPTRPAGTDTPNMAILHTDTVPHRTARTRDTRSAPYRPATASRPLPSRCTR